VSDNILTEEGCQGCVSGGFSYYVIRHDHIACESWCHNFCEKCSLLHNDEFAWSPPNEDGYLVEDATQHWSCWGGSCTTQSGPARRQLGQWGHLKCNKWTGVVKASVLVETLHVFPGYPIATDLKQSCIQGLGHKKCGGYYPWSYHSMARIWMAIPHGGTSFFPGLQKQCNTCCIDSHCCLIVKLISIFFYLCHHHLHKMLPLLWCKRCCQCHNDQPSRATASWIVIFLFVAVVHDD